MIDKNSIQRILIIKTSSMGDIIHFFPAICDLKAHLPNLTQIDWVVEENFKAIPMLHHHVNRVIPVSIRRWRKQLKQGKTYSEIKSFYKQMRSQDYDLVIDAQGLFKSAILTLCAKSNIKIGYDSNSIKEPIASYFYTHKMTISREIHAITRNRLLCAKALNYQDNLTLNQNNYAMNPLSFDQRNPLNLQSNQEYSLFLHGTSDFCKEWNYRSWAELGKRLIANHSRKIILLWSNQEEYDRCLKIIERINQPESCLMPEKILSFAEIAYIIEHSKDVFGVDTGLSHLASALNKCVLGIYMDTEPNLTGIDNAYNLDCPSVNQVYNQFLEMQK